MQVIFLDHIFVFSLKKLYKVSTETKECLSSSNVSCLILKYLWNLQTQLYKSYIIHPLDMANLQMNYSKFHPLS